MYKKINYLTTIAKKRSLTSYFFHKASSRVLPVETSVPRLNTSKATPSVYNTIKRMLVATGAMVSSIKLYLYRDGIFYTYITLRMQSNEYDINSCFIDALYISRLFNAPIYARDQVIRCCGIKVTKEQIEQALKETSIT